MNMVSFASLVKKCGYTVIPSNKKNNHTTNWTFEKIEELDIASKIDEKEDWFEYVLSKGDRNIPFFIFKSFNNENQKPKNQRKGLEIQTKVLKC